MRRPRGWSVGDSKVFLTFLSISSFKIQHALRVCGAYHCPACLHTPCVATRALPRPGSADCEFSTFGRSLSSTSHYSTLKALSETRACHCEAKKNRDWWCTAERTAHASRSDRREPQLPGARLATRTRPHAECARGSRKDQDRYLVLLRFQETRWTMIYQ